MKSVFWFELYMSFFFAVYAAILFYLAKENYTNPYQFYWICGLLAFLAIIFLIGGIVDFIEHRKEY